MVIFAASKNKIFKQNELEFFCFIISEPILQQIQSKKTRIKLIYHMKRATRKIFFFDEDRIIQMASFILLIKKQITNK